ncbi:MAG: hypothetical protein WCD53_00250 [Microcoleus sp.]
MTGLEVKLTPMGIAVSLPCFITAGTAVVKRFDSAIALPVELHPLKRDWPDLNLQPIG